MSDTTSHFLGLTPEEIKRYSQKYPELVEALKMAATDEQLADLFRSDVVDLNTGGALDALTTDEGNPIVCEGDPDNPFYNALTEAFEQEQKARDEVKADTPGFEIVTFAGAPESHPHLVFVYGSLLRGNHNNGRLKDDVYFREGLTKPEYTLYSLGPFPGMVEGGDVSVRGELFWLSHASLKHLDAMEGHPTFYCRTLIELSDGTFAWTYIYQMGAHGIVNPPVVKTGYWKDHFTYPAEIGQKMNEQRKLAARAAATTRYWHQRYADFGRDAKYYDKHGNEFVYGKDGRRVYRGKSEATRLREMTDYSSDDLKARLDSFSSGGLYYDEAAVDSIQQLRLVGALNNDMTVSDTEPLPGSMSARRRRREKQKMLKQEKAKLKKLRREIKSGKAVPKAWQGEILKWADKLDLSDKPLASWSEKK